MTPIPGRYNDGESATPHFVTVRLAGDIMEIAAVSGETLATWRTADIELVDEPARGRSVRLTTGLAPDARLTIEGADHVAALRAALPDLAKRRRHRTPRLRTVAVIVVGLLLLGAVFYAGFPRFIEFAAAWLPEGPQHRIGVETVDQIATMLGDDNGPRFCNASRGRAALDRLTGALVSHAPRPLDLTVQVLNVKAVNAFAAPGGQVVLFRGLLEAARSPDEIAGVLAHEIGHIVQRHPTQLMLRRVGLRVVSILLFGGERRLPGFGEQLLSLAYNRDDEREADEIGLALMKAAGFRVTGLRDFHQRMARKESGAPEIFAYLSSHPMSAERMARIAAAGDGGKPALSIDDWSDLATICN